MKFILLLGLLYLTSCTSNTHLISNGHITKGEKKRLIEKDQAFKYVLSGQIARNFADDEILENPLDTQTVRFSEFGIPFDIEDLLQYKTQYLSPFISISAGESYKVGVAYNQFDAVQLHLWYSASGGKILTYDSVKEKPLNEKMGFGFSREIVDDVVIATGISTIQVWRNDQDLESFDLGKSIIERKRFIADFQFGGEMFRGFVKFDFKTNFEPTVIEFGGNIVF